MKLLNACWRRFTRLLWPRAILRMRENSARWKNLRHAHLKKEPACVACGRSRNVEVHHIVPVSVDPLRELDPHNLITLCATPCHIVFGHFFCYHCYNKDVRKVAANFREAMQKQRRCLERF